jgi:hypothetical protein
MMDKKTEIRKYKDTAHLMGVFEIKNKLNGKILIGSSPNLKAIFNRFRAELNMGSCRNDLLQKDWNQFGPDAFEFKELDILTPSEDPNYNPAEDLEFLKDMWIEKLKPFGDNGYNRPPSCCI